MSNENDPVNQILNQGLEALKINANEKALELFMKAIKIDEKNTMAWNNKGVAQRKLGRLEEAIESYNMALKIEPYLTIALLNKARALRIMKKFDLALFTYEEILDIEPNHPLALEESEKVRDLLSRGARVKEDEELNKEEKELFEVRKQELNEFFEENKRSIADSVERIEELFENEESSEAEKNRDKICEAINSFNDQIFEQIKNISEEFITIDFSEECRELIEQWEGFREEQLKKLKSFN